MARVVVGVLRGGTSNEYNLSLKTGAAMIDSLPENQYDARDILVDKQGYWYSRGLRSMPARTLSQVDVVLNALHGGVGEDGSVQRILNRAGVPYVGSRAMPAALSLNKIRAHEILEKAGIPMPHAVAFTLGNGMTTMQMAKAVFVEFAPPYIVKPVNEGAGYGIKIALTIIELPHAIGDVLDTYGAAIVEEYLRGEEAQVGVIENFRGQDVYALPPVHVKLPPGSSFLDPSAHEGGASILTVPSDFTHEDKRALEKIARAAHKALLLSHFSRCDLIVTRRGPYLLEINAIPGLYKGAAMPPALESVGSSVGEYVRHALELSKR